MWPHPVVEKDVSHLTNGNGILSVPNALPVSLSNGRKSPRHSIRDRSESISVPFLHPGLLWDCSLLFYLRDERDEEKGKQMNTEGGLCFNSQRIKTKLWAHIPWGSFHLIVCIFRERCWRSQEVGALKAPELTLLSCSARTGKKSKGHKGFQFFLRVLVKVLGMRSWFWVLGFFLHCKK